MILGTNRHFWVMNCKSLHLRQQYFRCKCSVLFHFLACGKVGKGNVELCPSHIHIHTNDSFTFGELLTGFNGIVKEIADNAFQSARADRKRSAFLFSLKTIP